MKSIGCNDPNSLDKTLSQAENRLEGVLYMSPSEAVQLLVEIILSRDEILEEDLYTAMSEAEIPNPIADRAYKFTQAAWGRVYLEQSGVQYAPGYYCFNANGDVIESGLLANNPYFTAAMDWVNQSLSSPSFAKFANMSSDVNVVNHAVSNGSKPENLVLSPCAFFMEPPTASGVDKAKQLLAEKATARSKAENSGAGENKMGWRFW